jgi:hypothetical protein
MGTPGGRQALGDLGSSAQGRRSERLADELSSLALLVRNGAEASR